MRRRLTLLMPLITPVPALGQPLLLYLQLSFQEVEAITGVPVAQPNGVLEPGEGALIRMSISFIPTVGAVLPHPGPGVRTVHAFSFASVRVGPVFNDRGVWHSVSLGPGWLGGAGSPTPTGVRLISVRQFAKNADQSNPVENVWKAVWVPEDYSNRSVTVRAVAEGIAEVGMIWVHDSGPPAIYAEVDADSIISGQVQFLVETPNHCYANCDGSSVQPILNIEDFTCFVNEFAAGNLLPHAQQVGHYANCDGSMTAPVLNIDDFTCFINAFAKGCP